MVIHLEYDLCNCLVEIYSIQFNSIFVVPSLVVVVVFSLCIPPVAFSMQIYMIDGNFIIHACTTVS